MTPRSRGYVIAGRGQTGPTVYPSFGRRSPTADNPYRIVGGPARRTLAGSLEA